MAELVAEVFGAAEIAGPVRDPSIFLLDIMEH